MSDDKSNTERNVVRVAIMLVTGALGAKVFDKIAGAPGISRGAAQQGGFILGAFAVTSGR